MAHLWRIGECGEWAPTPLGGAALRLGPAVELRRVGAAAGDDWALLATPVARVAINGVPHRIGLAVLDDLDEIRLDERGAAFFSTETLAVVEPYPTAGPRGFCPRCKQQIEPASPAVRCPSCGLWHHASAELPCWTYAPLCAACAQDTALDAAFRWTPEDL